MSTSGGSDELLLPWASTCSLSCRRLKEPGLHPSRTATCPSEWVWVWVRDEDRGEERGGPREQTGQNLNPPLPLRFFFVASGGGASRPDCPVDARCWSLEVFGVRRQCVRTVEEILELLGNKVLGPAPATASACHVCPRPRIRSACKVLDLRGQVLQEKKRHHKLQECRWMSHQTAYTEARPNTTRLHR